MHPSSYHQPTVHIGVPATAHTNHLPALRPAPVAQKQLSTYPPRLYYTIQHNGNFKADLSDAQCRELAQCTAKILMIEVPVTRIHIESGKGFFSMNFVVDPRQMGPQTVVLCGHDGLEMLYASGIALCFIWNLDKSGAAWPAWLKPHNA